LNQWQSFINLYMAVVLLLSCSLIKDGLLVDLWDLESQPVSILVPCDGR